MLIFIIFAYIIIHTYNRKRITAASYAIIIWMLYLYVMNEVLSLHNMLNGGHLMWIWGTADAGDGDFCYI